MVRTSLLEDALLTVANGQGGGRLSRKRAALRVSDISICNENCSF